MANEDRVIFKYEDDNVGPVYVVRDGKRMNYADSDRESTTGGKHAKWFSLAQAKKIAKQLNLKLEEV